MSYLLPATADTTAPTIVGFKYPPNLSTGTPRDPVDIELTAYDERGDMDYVDLKVGNQLIQRTEVYPFQFRYTPPASAVGSVVTLTAEAVDSAGNKSTRDLLSQRARRRHAARHAGGRRAADAARHADRRLAAVLPQRRVPQPAQDADLRLAAQRRRRSPARRRRRTRSPPPTSAARSPAAITATNDAGSGDATSDSLIVSNPAPAFTADAAAAVVHDDQRHHHDDDHHQGGRRHLQGDLQARLQQEVDLLHGLLELQPRSSPARSACRARRPARSPSRSKSRKAKLTLKSSKALKKGQKVVLKIKSGKTTKVVTVKAS